MNRLIKTIEKLTIVVIIVSILISFLATPASYAKLDLKDGEFYYSGTTKGTYTVTEGIWSWLLSAIGDIADWLLGIMTLGFRMVFVGWTALIEKLLTWALETTTGVSVDGSLVESSTDLTSLTDSSNNVTVENIVYNKVPALDINIFDSTWDRTISGTGHKLVCDCGKNVEECITLTEEEAQAIMTKIDEGTSDIKTEAVNACGCDCKGCEYCQTYIKQLAADEPVIMQLRKLVAEWYTIIRLLAVAAMLVVLIGVGIKMAISTIASDKAVYKRMLIDWIAGMVIMFTLHYFMIFVIYMNNILVNVIEEASKGATSAAMSLLSDEEKNQLSDSNATYNGSEIEIKVYEEIRSRAYDAKLINGIMGLVMYMTLVYMAIRYTIIYIKRLFTIIVLTLMAPGVGVAYALQKALSGKSQALKTWMTEYINNAIIQVIHAILYAIFISQALVLSLQNITGMIVALIIMNYTMKADKLFKKIFKFGEGDSLAGHTADAADNLRESLNTARGVAMGAKPLAKALTNTPYGKAVKAIGKGAVALGTAGAAGGLAIGGKVADSKVGQAVGNAVGNAAKNVSNKRANNRYDKAFEKEVQNVTGGKSLDSATDAEKARAEQSLRDKGILPPAEIEANRNAMLEHDDEILGMGEKQLNKNFNDAEAAYLADPNNEDKEKAYNTASADLVRHHELTSVSSKDIAIGHAQRLMQLENVFKVKQTNSFGANVKALANGTFGTLYFDKNKMKFVREKDSMFDQYRASNLLGLTDNDKKLLKQEILNPMKSGVLGMASLFAGMGTIVVNPTLGMGLLAYGVPNTAKVLKKPTGVRGYKGRYAFSRYGIPTMDTLKTSAIARARQERNGYVVDKVAKSHPSLAQRIRTGNVSVGTLMVTAVPFAVGTLASNRINAFKRYGVKGAYKRLNAKKGTKKSFKERAKEYRGNVLKTTAQPAISLGKGVANNAQRLGDTMLHPIGTIKNAGENHKLDKAMMEAYGIESRSARFFGDHLECIDLAFAKQQKKQEQEFKEDTARLIAMQAAAEIDAIERKADQDIMKAYFESQGYDVEFKLNGEMKIKPKVPVSVTEETKTVYEKVDDGGQVDLKDVKLSSKGKSITSADIALINSEMEAYVLEYLASKGNLAEINSADAIKNISAKLGKVLPPDVNVNEIFKSGKFNKTLQRKFDSARKANEILFAESKKQKADAQSQLMKSENFTEKERQAIIKAVEEAGDLSKVSSDDILLTMSANAPRGKKDAKLEKHDNDTRKAEVEDYMRKIKESQKSADDATQILSQISTDLGSAIRDDGQRIGNIDKERFVNANSDQKTQEAVRMYTMAIQSMSPKTVEVKDNRKTRKKIESENIEEVKKEAIKEMKKERSSRKDKLQQIMALSMDIDLENASNSYTAKDEDGKKADDIIEQLKKVKEGSQTEVKSGSKSVPVTKEVAETADLMVKKLLEIKAANEIAIDELEMKKGAGYEKARSEKAKLTIEKHNKQKLQYEIELLVGSASSDESKKIIKGECAIGRLDEKYNEKTKDEVISMINSDISNITIKEENAKRKMKTVGPVYNIEDLIKNQMGRR